MKSRTKTQSSQTAINLWFEVLNLEDTIALPGDLAPQFARLRQDIDTYTYAKERELLIGRLDQVWRAYVLSK